MKRFAFFSILIILAFLASLTLADIPKLINYQGMLTDDSGTPLNGDFEISFEIYNDSLGGVWRWGETQPAVSVTNGLFNVILGSVNPLNLDFSEDYWMEITVGGQMMPGRLRFTSVGYAYRASIADSALTTAPGSGSNWSVSNSVLYTNQYWGIARGGAGNALFGDSAYSHVNLGVACTTGTNGASYYYCVVGGGNFNSATDQYTTVGGGYKNRATYYGATIAGGYGNLASEYNATVGGGEYDTASAMYATVAGGYKNRATNNAATVGGGDDNLASGHHATLAGGSDNYATGWGATVSGGTGNEASGKCATVVGGISNTASGAYSFAAGRGAEANHLGTFVWADSSATTDFASTGNNQFLIRAGGGVGIGTNSPSVETRLHVQAVSDDFGVLVDAAGTSGTEIGLHTATSQYASLVKNAYFDAGGWQRFNTGQGAYLQEVKPDGEVWFRVVDAGANPISWTNAMAIRNSGNVGIGTTNPQGYQLFVNGTAAKPGGGSWDNPSDIRLKRVNGAYECGLSEISQLKPTHYNYREGNELGLPTEREYVGLVAQDVLNVIPDAVTENEDGYLVVDNDPIIWAMLNAIKELKAQNDELRRRIEALENR